MTAVLVASGAFLLAVLWMDLMFDVQSVGLARADTAARETALASIAGYYRRVTTEAFPMNRLIAAVMLVQLGGIVHQVLREPALRGVRALVVVVLGVAPPVFALTRIVPDAVRLAAGRDDIAMRSILARRIFHAHIACFVAVAAFVVLEARLR